jgi:hypothetical protein
VLRYGSRMAVLWTTRRIVPPAPTTAPMRDIAQRMAATPVPPPAPVQAAPAPATASTSQSQTVGLGNVTALYTDKLTGGR